MGLSQVHTCLYTPHRTLTQLAKHYLLTHTLSSNRQSTNSINQCPNHILLYHHKQYSCCINNKSANILLLSYRSLHTSIVNTHVRWHPILFIAMHTHTYRAAVIAYDINGQTNVDLTYNHSDSSQSTADFG